VELHDVVVVAYMQECRSGLVTIFQVLRPLGWKTLSENANLLSFYRELRIDQVTKGLEKTAGPNMGNGLAD
jgi:hypothetical protein